MVEVAVSEAAAVINQPTVAPGNLRILTKTSPDPAGVEALARDRAARCASLPTFEQLFRRFAPYVLHALPYLGIAEADVEDVCQDIFTTVYVNIGKFEGRSSIRTWIYGICLNKALNYRRTAYRRRERLEPGSEQGVESQQFGELEQKQTRVILDRALAELDQSKREVFVLYEIEELSMSEVAQALGCPLFTAYSRLYAARREIKKTVERIVAENQINGSKRV